MATLSLSALHSIVTHKPNCSLIVPSSSPTLLPCQNVRLREHGVAGSSRRWIATRANPIEPRRGVRRVRSVGEGETPVPAQEDEQASAQQEGEAEAASSSEQQQAVSVPVSASDTLTMFFQADGTMSEAAIPGVTNALEGIEGIANLKVQVVEGIASVELEKQTTVQATGVASSLVETLQGSGFKLQTLNLSFNDEENVAV
ncbi:Heavy metal-associated domain containing protein [Trema orientale]|uniref:Heavy metal-associated domain containing protein n=1 Tax=Trema orientale TaxID=63057 RepID=A0A2P5DRT9_TREOI|nr:Heavy metal-associated domain containing protein [Trema orientale]